MFRKIYNYTLNLANHRLAERYLIIVGFFESIIFPIPADVMLAPMCLKEPSKAYRYATVLSIASILGGVIGYCIGYFFADFAVEVFGKLGVIDAFNSFKDSFNKWGFVLVFVAGFSPFPYKIVTIGSGLLGILFPVFFLGSVISRPIRFFLVAFAIKKGGEKLEKTINKYVEWIGWICLILLALGLFLMYIK